MSDPRSLLTPEDNLVLEKLRTKGEAWIVGGWVREALLGNLSPDLDIATTLTPSKVKELFPRTIPIGEDYGTVIVRLDKEIVGEWEVTTLRKEGTYGDGRRPDNVLFGENIEDDLARRDFTINAMAINSNGDLIDIFGGEEDLRCNILRAVGDARERIAEDGLRIMRAFRFLDKDDDNIRLMDEELESAIRENRRMLDKVSSERIGEEIRKILSKKNSYKILLKMEETGVLEDIFDGLTLDIGEKEHNNPLVILSKILRKNELEGSEVALKLRDCLKFSKKELDLVSFLHENRNVDFETDIGSLRRFNIYLSKRQKEAILEYHKPTEFINKLNNLKESRDDVSPLIDGITLSEHTGIKPGPKLGNLKGWLYRQQIERNITTKEKVLELLENISLEENYENLPTLSWP
jgi:tRNA nucleotidyltransferase (CCA-adding enzyme)